jgi:hypothetical protein
LKTETRGCYRRYQRTAGSLTALLVSGPVRGDRATQWSCQNNSQKIQKPSSHFANAVFEHDIKTSERICFLPVFCFCLEGLISFEFCCSTTVYPQSLYLSATHDSFPTDIEEGGDNGNSSGRLAATLSRVIRETKTRSVGGSVDGVSTTQTDA